MSIKIDTRKVSEILTDENDASSSSQFTTAACSSFFASDTDTPTTCICVLLAILLVEFFIDIYVYVIQYKDRGRLNQIEDQLSILKEKEMKLHGIDNFTKRAKIQRTINALEKDQKPLKALLDDSFISAFTSSSNSSVAAFLFKKGWKYLSQPFLIGLIAGFGREGGWSGYSADDAHWRSA